MGLCTLPLLWELFAINTVALVSCLKSNIISLTLKNLHLKAKTSVGKFSFGMHRHY
jgi:hypothetical protein